jgi:aspartate/methionine/tyrosine aminotransferase
MKKPKTVDMALIARSTPYGFTNLAIGEPKLVQAGLKQFYPKFMIPDSDQGYPRSGGDLDLISRIKEFHNIPQKHVVLVSGAKQGLIAAMAAALKLSYSDVYTSMVPYWPSLPTLAAHAGLNWTSDLNDYQVIIDTWPNNPTGYNKDAQNHFEGSFIIRDSVYDSPIFDAGLGADMAPDEADDPEVVVDSASKRYGLSGIRLGWISTDHSDIADAITEYVETTTSGVSTLSQTYFSEFLDTIMRGPVRFELATDCINEQIANNGKTLINTIGDHVTNMAGVPSGDGGMFAWFKPKHSKKFRTALEKTKILFVDGSSAGVDGYYRVNMAESQELTSAAMQALGEALNDSKS